MYKFHKDTRPAEVNCTYITLRINSKGTHARWVNRTCIILPINSTGTQAAGGGAALQAVSRQDVESGRGSVSKADTSIISVGASYRAQQSGEAAGGDQRPAALVRRASSIYDRRAWAGDGTTTTGGGGGQGPEDVARAESPNNSKALALPARQLIQGQSPRGTGAIASGGGGAGAGAPAATGVERAASAAADESSGGVNVERERSVNLESLAQISPFEGISSTPITGPRHGPAYTCPSCGEGCCAGGESVCRRPCPAAAAGAERGRDREAISCCGFSAHCSQAARTGRGGGTGGSPHNSNSNSSSREVRTCCSGCRCKCRCKGQKLVDCCRCGGGVVESIPGNTTSPSSDRQGGSDLQGLLLPGDSCPSQTSLAVSPTHPGCQATPGHTNLAVYPPHPECQATPGHTNLAVYPPHPGCQVTPPSPPRDSFPGHTSHSWSGQRSLSVYPPHPGCQATPPPAAISGPQAPGKTGFSLGTGEQDSCDPSGDDTGARGNSSDNVPTEALPASAEERAERNGLTLTLLNASQTAAHPALRLQEAQCGAPVDASQDKASLATAVRENSARGKPSSLCPHRRSHFALRSGLAGTWTDEEIDAAGGNDLTTQPFPEEPDHPVSYYTPRGTKMARQLPQASKGIPRKDFHIGPNILKMIKDACSNAKQPPRKQKQRSGSLRREGRQDSLLQRRSRQRFSVPEDFREGRRDQLHVAWEEQGNEAERGRRAGELGLSPGGDRLVAERILLPAGTREQIHASGRNERQVDSLRPPLCSGDGPGATEGATAAYVQHREIVKLSFAASDKTITSPANPVQRPTSESGGGVNHTRHDAGGTVPLLCSSEKGTTEGDTSYYSQHRENAQRSFEPPEKTLTSPTYYRLRPASESGSGVNHERGDDVLPRVSGPPAQVVRASAFQPALPSATRGPGSCPEMPESQSPGPRRPLRPLPPEARTSASSKHAASESTTDDSSSAKPTLLTAAAAARHTLTATAITTTAVILPLTTTTKTTNVASAPGHVPHAKALRSEPPGSSNIKGPPEFSSNGDVTFEDETTKKTTTTMAKAAALVSLERRPLRASVNGGEGSAANAAEHMSRKSEPAPAVATHRRSWESSESAGLQANAAEHTSYNAEPEPAVTTHRRSWWSPERAELVPLEGSNAAEHTSYNAEPEPAVATHRRSRESSESAGLQGSAANAAEHTSRKSEPAVATHRRSWRSPERAELVPLEGSNAAEHTSRKSEPGPAVATHRRSRGSSESAGLQGSAANAAEHTSRKSEPGPAVATHRRSRGSSERAGLQGSAANAAEHTSRKSEPGPAVATHRRSRGSSERAGLQGSAANAAEHTSRKSEPGPAVATHRRSRESSESAGLQGSAANAAEHTSRKSEPAVATHRRSWRSPERAELVPLEGSNAAEHTSRKSEPGPAVATHRRSRGSSERAGLQGSAANAAEHTSRNSEPGPAVATHRRSRESSESAGLQGSAANAAEHTSRKSEPAVATHRRSWRSPERAELVPLEGSNAAEHTSRKSEPGPAVATHRRSRGSSERAGLQGSAANAAEHTSRKSEPGPAVATHRRSRGSSERAEPVARRPRGRELPPCLLPRGSAAAAAAVSVVRSGRLAGQPRKSSSAPTSPRKEPPSSGPLDEAAKIAVSVLRLRGQPLGGASETAVSRAWL